MLVMKEGPYHLLMLRLLVAMGDLCLLEIVRSIVSSSELDNQSTS
jgi:hypothetical protein